MIKRKNTINIQLIIWTCSKKTMLCSIIPFHLRCEVSKLEGSECLILVIKNESLALFPQWCSWEIRGRVPDGAFLKNVRHAYGI